MNVVTARHARAAGDASVHRVRPPLTTPEDETLCGQPIPEDARASLRDVSCLACLRLMPLQSEVKHV